MVCEQTQCLDPCSLLNVLLQAQRVVGYTWVNGCSVAVLRYGKHDLWYSYYWFRFWIVYIGNRGHDQHQLEMILPTIRTCRIQTRCSVALVV